MSDENKDNLGKEQGNGKKGWGLNSTYNLKGIKKVLLVILAIIIVIIAIISSINLNIDSKINKFIKQNEIDKAYNLLDIAYKINHIIFKNSQISIEKLYKMACIDFSIGNTEQSLEKFYYIEKKLKNKKTEIYLATLTDIISINYLNGNYEDSKKYLNVLKMNYNENLESLSFIVKFSYLLHNNEDTKNYYKKFIETNTNNERDKFIQILNLIELYSIFNQNVVINEGDINYIIYFMKNKQTDYTKYLTNNALAEYYLKQTDREKSLLYISELKRLIDEYNPSFLRYYFYISYLMYRNNNIDDALQILEKLKYSLTFTEKNNKYETCINAYTNLYLKNINIENTFCKNLLEIRGI